MWSGDAPFQGLGRNVSSISLTSPRKCAETALGNILVLSAFVSLIHGSYWKTPTFSLSCQSLTLPCWMFPHPSNEQVAQTLNCTTASLCACPFFPGLLLPNPKHCAMQYLTGQPFPGLGFCLASWQALQCLLLLEHCPELQPPWQGHWQPSWPSATILFLPATGQSTVSTQIALSQGPLLLTINWISVSMIHCSVLPLLCSCLPLDGIPWTSVPGRSSPVSPHTNTNSTCFKQ